MPRSAAGGRQKIVSGRLGHYLLWRGFSSHRGNIKTRLLISPESLITLRQTPLRRSLCIPLAAFHSRHSTLWS